MKHENPAEKNQKKNSTKDKAAAADLEGLEQAELSGDQTKVSSLAASSTDENEDEGLGDGKIGRSKNDLTGK